jgi:F-type H+-transporting ATPase subunit epsilon
MTIRCEIVSQDRVVFEGDVDIVIAPGTFGEMGILPNHAPLISTLSLGILTTRSDKDEEHFTISGGIIEVQPNIVTVLADAAENVEEIDISRAQEARERAEQILRKGPPPDMDEYLAMQATLKRSQLRLEAANRYRRSRRRVSSSRESGTGSATSTEER